MVFRTHSWLRVYLIEFARVWSSSVNENVACDWSWNDPCSIDTEKARHIKNIHHLVSEMKLAKRTHTDFSVGKFNVNDKFLGKMHWKDGSQTYVN